MFQRNWSPTLVPEVFRDFSSRKRLVVAASQLALDLFREEKSRKTSGTRRRRNARLFEMQNFIPAYMKGWTYVRTYPVRTIFSEPKFLGHVDYQLFSYPWCSAALASRERELRYEGRLFSRAWNLEKTKGNSQPRPQAISRGLTWVNFFWACAAGLSEPLPH